MHEYGVHTGWSAWITESGIVPVRSGSRVFVTPVKSPGGIERMGALADARIEVTIAAVTAMYIAMIRRNSSGLRITRIFTPLKM
jgi:hypothetical protein